MNKEVEVRFDKDAYKEYEELQEFVAEGRSSKRKPTYEQLLSSINTAIKCQNFPLQQEVASFACFQC